MARPRTRDGGLFPAGFVTTLIRRLIEGAGLAVMMVAVLLAAALVSFNVADPSWNHASGLAPLNLLGAPGAVFADLALRSVGIAALAPVLSLALWGWLLIGRHRIPRPSARFAGILGATILLAVALAAAPAPPGWPLDGGLGGFLGAGLLRALSVAPWGGSGSSPSTAIATAAGLLGVVGLIWGFGLSLADWRAAPGRLCQAAARVRQSAIASATLLPALPIRLIWPRATGPSQPADPESLRRRAPVAAPATGAPAPAPAVADPQRVAQVVAPKPARSVETRRPPATRQGALDLDGPAAGYLPPPLDLLHEAPPRASDDTLSRDALQQNARMLANVLDDFGVRGEIARVRPGPVITLYELEPAPGTKTSRVIGLADDIARSMSAISVRVAVVPGRNIIGVELPNQRRETVYLRELLAADGFERTGAVLTLALGKDIGGAPVYVDLARMPHLLIAGTTGSGKSVAINTMILSLLYRHGPETCKLILIDPKMLELSVYDGIPHLLAPVVTDPGKAVVALKWAVREMEERYRMMSQLAVRNVAGFNARISEARARGEALVRRVQTGFDEDGHPVYEDQPLDLEPLPFIVIVVDEMADLMLVAGKDIEAAVQRLAQMARAAGIHLVLATQRPSVDVITGTIKANFPTRMSFRVASKIDSRTILGEQGAEQLLGQGDMLYMAGGARLSRVHGPFVADEEVEAVVTHLRGQGEPAYLAAVTEESDDDGDGSGGTLSPGSEGGDEADSLYDEAVALVARDGKASTSYIQRRLQIGYNRAARLVERMEAEGVVSKPDRVGRREVLVGDHSE